MLGEPVRNHVLNRWKDNLVYTRRDGYPYQLVVIAQPVKEWPRDVLKAVSRVIGMEEPDPKPPAPVFPAEPATEKGSVKRFIT